MKIKQNLGSLKIGKLESFSTHIFDIKDETAC